MSSSTWPSLSRPQSRDTRATLHRYVQIVGKIQLATTPHVCHYWNVALELSARGLATPALPYAGRLFQIELDFVDHAVITRSSDGRSRTLPLRPRAVADFYAELVADLDALGIRVPIWDHPVEVFSEPIPFSEDHVHRAYDPDWVGRFWRVLAITAEALGEFRSRFIGKASPVGFYWGTFDLAASRYSGRRAPNPPASGIEREAFSHEVSEAGFWPGDVRYEEPAFYALHAPTPEGFDRADVRPKEAHWENSMSSYLLPYEVVRNKPSPRATLLEFYESAYEAGARLAGWNRTELERAS